MKTLDLNVDSPDKVAGILRNAAEAYRNSASELTAAWQDKYAGKDWDHIARILERVADQVARFPSQWMLRKATQW